MGGGEGEGGSFQTSDVLMLPTRTLGDVARVMTSLRQQQRRAVQTPVARRWS